MKDLEQYILAQFKKKMKMEDRNDLNIQLETEETITEEGFGFRFINEAIITERKDNGKVWTITTYSTGRIKQIYEI